MGCKATHCHLSCLTRPLSELKLHLFLEGRKQCERNAGKVNWSFALQSGLELCPSDPLRFGALPFKPAWSFALQAQLLRFNDSASNLKSAAHDRRSLCCLTSAYQWLLVWPGSATPISAKQPPCLQFVKQESIPAESLPSQWHGPLCPKQSRENFLQTADFPKIGFGGELRILLRCSPSELICCN